MEMGLSHGLAQITTVISNIAHFITQNDTGYRLCWLFKSETICCRHMEGEKVIKSGKCVFVDRDMVVLLYVLTYVGCDDPSY